MSRGEIIELENGFTRNRSAVGSEIATARTKMTAQELKAFYQVSALVDKEHDKFFEYQIHAKDFARKLNFSLTNNDVKNACRSLVERTFEIENAKTGEWEIYPIFSSFKFDPKTQIITISFNDKMRPHLLQLKQFTKIENVEYITKFNKKHAIRIYALLKDYRKMTYRDIDVEALKKILGLEPKKPKKGEPPKRSTYDDYGNVRKKILEPAMKEINEKSDLYISAIEEIKKERKKVLKIRIHFENQGKRIAEQRIKLLLDHYERNKENWGFKVFIGYKYHQNGHIGTITQIKQEAGNNYHALYCDNSDLVMMSCHDGKTFLNWLCNGIMDAVEIYAEKEKERRLDVFEWQNEQDRIALYKEIINGWIEKR